MKSKLKLLYLQYTLTKDILQSSIREDTLSQRKGWYFEEGSLTGFCLSGLWFALCVCDICEKMYIVHKELTCDWVKSKVAKCKFYLQKNSKRRRTGGKFTISSTKFHVNFFLWCWIMWLEYVIKCRLFTRKWHVTERGPIWRNGIWLVEYNSSTWKIVQCSCRAMVWYVLIGL